MDIETETKAVLAEVKAEIGKYDSAIEPFWTTHKWLALVGLGIVAGIALGHFCR